MGVHDSEDLKEEEEFTKLSNICMSEDYLSC